MRYVSGEGVPRDLVEAAKWLILSASQGGDIGRMAREQRESIAAEKTPAMIDDAWARAREWTAGRPPAARKKP